MVRREKENFISSLFNGSLGPKRMTNCFFLVPDEVQETLYAFFLFGASLLDFVVIKLTLRDLYLKTKTGRAQELGSFFHFVGNSFYLEVTVATKLFSRFLETREQFSDF